MVETMKILGINGIKVKIDNENEFDKVQEIIFENKGGWFCTGNEKSKYNEEKHYGISIEIIEGDLTMGFYEDDLSFNSNETLREMNFKEFVKFTNLSKMI